MRFTSLSSGSEGNALVVESATPTDACGSPLRDPTRVLIDCGLAAKEMLRRLEDRGLSAHDLDAIFVTHEHQDHVGGVARLARLAGLPVLCSHGTRQACPEDFWSGVSVTEVDSDAEISLCDLRLRCFPVPHDAREPVQLVVEDRVHRMGVLTDVGRSTVHIEQMLSGVDALFLEANHDEALLAASDYPPSLRERIAGPYGHLSNTASAAILAAIDQSRLQHVVAAHLSRHNNREDLVTSAFAPVMSASARLHVARQDRGFDWIMLA